VKWHWAFWRPLPNDRREQADQAVQNAEERLKRVRSQTDEVHELAENLRTHREENHYTEKIRNVMRRI
jgi:type II secretory pathway component PulM